VGRKSREDIKKREKGGVGREKKTLNGKGGKRHWGNKGS